MAAVILLLAGAVAACAVPGECKRSSDCTADQSCAAGLCPDATAGPADGAVAGDGHMTAVGTPGADASRGDAAAE